MEAQASILEQIPNNYTDPDWLEENAQEVYEVLRDQSRDANQLDDIVYYMLLLVPQMLNREDLKRWGRLLEQVYLRTPMGEANGLDGSTTAEYAQDFVMQKRPKVPQLPTKTQRRKRVILHPKQMFEIYLILLMATYYKRVRDMPEGLIESTLRFARTVNDPYCNNKLHQALAFIYNQLFEGELAVVHAQTAYAYWKEHENTLEAGLSAYALGIAYQITKDLQSAQQWLNTAADLLAQTSFRRQHLFVAESLTRLKLLQNDLEQAYDWANVALEEAHALDLPNHIASIKHYRAIASMYVGNLDDATADLEDAMRLLADQGNSAEYMHCEQSLAFVEYRRGERDAALERLNTLRASLEPMPQSGWKDDLLQRVNRLTEAIRNNENIVERPGN